MSTWDEIRVRLEQGDLTVGEFLELSAGVPGTMPSDITAARINPAPRSPGRPRQWSERELAAINNLCKNLRFWSELETRTPDGKTRPVSMEKIYQRVGPMLRTPVDGPTLKNKLSAWRRSVRGSGRIWAFSDDDYKRILQPRFWSR